jgi:hypothetical protein
VIARIVERNSLRAARCGSRSRSGAALLAHWSVIACSAMAALMLAGCGERPQVVQYKQGKYQGKPDEPPYVAAPFNGDQTKWERDVRNRTQNQNEYKRIGS